MESERDNLRRLAPAIALGAVALSVVGRLWLLAARPLWTDEVFTVWISRLSPAAILSALRNDSGPPLFYFLEKPLVAAAEALRLPDTTARALPLLAVLLLFVAARRLPRGGPRGLFLLLTAASPLLLLYAAEARAYAPLALFDFCLFLLATREPAGRRDLAATAIVAALALWTHYLALFFVAALALACLAAGRRRSCAALLAGAALSLSWLPILLRQPREATAWMHEPAMNSGLGFLAALGGAARIPAPFGPPLPRALLWIAAVTAIALIAATAAAWRAAPEIQIGSAAVLLTLGGVLAVSSFQPVAFAGRTEMAVLPVWLWVVARTAAARRPVRWIAAGAAAVAVAACFMVLSRAPSQPPPQETLLRRLKTETRREDRIVASFTFYIRARLASDRGELAGRLDSFPADVAGHPGWFAPRPLSEEDYAHLAANLEEAAGRRVFFLLDPPYRTPRLEQLLLSRGALREIEVRPRGVLLLSTPRAF